MVGRDEGGNEDDGKKGRQGGREGRRRKGDREEGYKFITSCLPVIFTIIHTIYIPWHFSEQTLALQFLVCPSEVLSMSFVFNSELCDYRKIGKIKLVFDKSKLIMKTENSSSACFLLIQN